ncbi:hypothetical protein HF086_013372 [Spodoptera exigua]|uniref:Uncharacterized protein n=1 Tax=Spodoptera exigua TaxID=7107 RepID=A0A922MJ97_SPOEX|nr:hypothetical protein HF086_013372 [Spodoptera exigua]
MANSGRVVYPKEVAEATKQDVSAAKAEDKSSGGEEVVVVKRESPAFAMIQVPNNCPANKEMANDGVCREVT